MTVLFSKRKTKLLLEEPSHVIRSVLSLEKLFGIECQRVRLRMFFKKK